MSTYQFPMLDVHQARTHEPTEWEITLADALEDAFGKGVTDLPDVIDALNKSRVRPRSGGLWTSENFTSLMAQLGA